MWYRRLQVPLLRLRCHCCFCCSSHPQQRLRSLLHHSSFVHIILSTPTTHHLLLLRHRHRYSLSLLSPHRHIAQQQPEEVFLYSTIHTFFSYNCFQNLLRRRSNHHQQCRVRSHVVRMYLSTIYIRWLRSIEQTVGPPHHVECQFPPDSNCIMVELCVMNRMQRKSGESPRIAGYHYR